MTIKEKLHRVVFESDTKAGRLFDIVLLFLICVSMAAVMLESIPSIGSVYTNVFFTLEIILTIIFAAEYCLRIYISPKRSAYILSFWGLIDLVSIIPFLLILLFPGVQFLMTIRAIRLLRIFRIAKLVRFVEEAQILLDSIRTSLYKISTFFFAVLIIVIVMGSLMYVVEGPENGFTSIPQSIYWAIITITTVGYGDIVPSTVLGKFISSFVMIIGYAIIAVPTGIFTVEMAKSGLTKKKCEKCSHGNEASAKFCNNCGNAFEKN